MGVFHKLKKYIYLRNDEAFAIPQILLLGLGIAIGISSLISASITNLTGSKISKQELIAKSASYSGITRLRTLFNDNGLGRLLNYFWIVNNCSALSNNCDSENIQLPPDEYWSDDLWCDGEENCSGRQKAPICTSNNNISWINEQELVKNLFNYSQRLNNLSNNNNSQFNQAFNIISSKYIGTENGGINSILIEGLATPVLKIPYSEKDQKITQSASNKVRVNIKVNSYTNESGFGFLSAGENNSDKTDSLFLGNILIKPLNNAKGSIIWRMNINNESECEDIKNLAKGQNTSLGTKNNERIWIQPINQPKQPRLKNVIDLGTLICTQNNYEKLNSKCKIDSGVMPQKTFRIYSLFVKGPNSKFEISTKDNAKIILEIMGDIDISNGGLICHKNGLEECGTGKPENLTILFKQKTFSKLNKLICNRDNNEGGIKFNNDYIYSNLSQPLNNNLLPGSSFLIDNTGSNINENFGAFIYGPKTTFLSELPKNNWVQVNQEDLNYENRGLVITSRGAYGYIEDIAGSSIKDKITNLILDSDFRLIPYGGNKKVGSNNIQVIGIGKRIDVLPPDANIDPSTKNVFLLFDNLTLDYHLRSFRKVVINPSNNKNLQNSFPGSFAILNPKNIFNDVNLGKRLDEDLMSKAWLKTFDIEVKNIDNNFIRNFTGAAWVKNLCFDNTGEKSWEFSKEFIDNLISWHGNDFNWGIKYYRGQSIILWDTLRDFSSN